MINQKSDIQAKERHDIFDVVLLKQKEKKVLYLLLVVFVVVLGYENSEMLLNKLFPAYEIAIPVKARNYILNTDKLDQLSSQINEFSSDLPQFHVSFAAIVSKVNSVKIKINESVKRKEILKLQHQIVSNLWIMLNSPYLEKSEKQTSIKKYVSKLMKKMKLSTEYIVEVSPVLFNKNISKTLTKPSRSIFEFADDMSSNNTINYEEYWNNVDDENMGVR